MQWTDESGRAYGEDPYGGAGYAYAYGYGYSGSATPDTAAHAWDPVRRAQWTHSTGNAHPATMDPYAAGMHLYAAGPGPVTATWDAPPGDVLTVPPPELDRPGPPAPEPDNTPKSESVQPVFVDSSGRRQRRVLRAARLLVIPAGGYVALLISTLLGGPSLSAPFVPQPDSKHPTTPHASAPDSSSGAGHSAGSGSSTAAQKSSRPTAAQTSSPTGRPTTSTSSAATSTPSALPTGITSPTPTAHPTSKGRAIGSSHKPVK